MDKRQVLLTAFLGYTGSGKTTLMLESIRHWRKTHPGKKIIVFDPHSVFFGLGLHDAEIINTDDKWAQRLLSKKIIGKDKQGKDIYGDYIFKDSLLVLDDYRELIKGNECPPDVLTLLQRRRHIGMDIMYATHSPKLVHVRFTIYTNTYLLFYTESSPNDFSDRIPKYQLCQKAANLINKYVIAIGGVDSPKYRSHYPNFPYCIVKTWDEKIEAINIDGRIVEKTYK